MIDDDRKLEVFDALVHDWLGGEDVARMVYQRHAMGWSYGQIAAEHGEPKTTVWRLICAARAKLRRLGLMPAEWEAPIIDDDRRSSAAAGPPPGGPGLG